LGSRARVQVRFRVRTRLKVKVRVRVRIWVRVSVRARVRVVGCASRRCATLAQQHAGKPAATLHRVEGDRLQQGGALGGREREVEEAHDAIHLRRQAAHEVLIVDLVRVRVRVRVRARVRVRGARRRRNQRLWRGLPEAQCAATCCLSGGGAPLECGAQPARASRSLC